MSSNFRRHNSTPMALSSIAIIWLFFLIQFWMSGSIQVLQRHHLLWRLFRLNNENQKYHQNFQQKHILVIKDYTVFDRTRLLFCILLAKWLLVLDYIMT